MIQKTRSFFEAKIISFEKKSEKIICKVKIQSLSKEVSIHITEAAFKKLELDVGNYILIWNRRTPSGESKGWYIDYKNTFDFHGVPYKDWL